MLQEVAFWVLSVASVGGAVGVVLRRDVFRAALLLVVVFLAVAGLFAMMNAEFLAVVQVLIYAGAIAILIIFAIMLTREVQQGNLPNRLQLPAVVLPGLLLAAFVYVALDSDWNTQALADGPAPQEEHLRGQHVEGQALRWASEALQSSTVAGLPAGWEDEVERQIQRSIDDDRSSAAEHRGNDRSEEAAQYEAAAELAEEERIFLEQGLLVARLGPAYLEEFVETTSVTALSQRVLDALAETDAGLEDVTEIRPKVQPGKWWLAGSDGDLKYSVVSTGIWLDVYEGRYEAAEVRSGIGELLINDYVLPFEIASVLLLAAVIGGLVLMREA